MPAKEFNTLFSFEEAVDKLTSPTPTLRGLLPLQARDSPRRPRGHRGSASLSVLAASRIYPTSPNSRFSLLELVGAYRKSRLSLLELGLTTAPQQGSINQQG